MKRRLDHHDRREAIANALSLAATLRQVDVIKTSPF